MKVRREKNLSNDASIYELINFIETKYYEMLRVANTELVTLFWRIGKEVNKYPAVTGINEKDIFSFSHISKLLSARYSKAFEQQNLDSMSRFANLFPKYPCSGIPAFLRCEQVERVAKRKADKL